MAHRSQLQCGSWSVSHPVEQIVPAQQLITFDIMCVSGTVGGCVGGPARAPRLCVFVCESGELRHAVFETNLVLLSEPGCDSGRQPDEITRREDDDNGGKNSATKHTPKY